MKTCVHSPSAVLKDCSLGLFCNLRASGQSTRFLVIARFKILGKIHKTAQKATKNGIIMCNRTDIANSVMGYLTDSSIENNH